LSAVGFNLQSQKLERSQHANYLRNLCLYDIDVVYLILTAASMTLLLVRQYLRLEARLSVR